jgi:hypothetical protein
MDRVAGSFGFPFRPGAGRAWLVGIALLVLLPLGVVPLLGYAVAVAREAAADPDAGPPAWQPVTRLLREGFLLAVVLGVLTAPFVLLAWVLAAPLAKPVTLVVSDPSLRAAVAEVIGGALAGLPWGILLLVLMPSATARFARSGSARDLVDVRAALATVRRRFPTWNLAVVAIVTAWAVGLCGLGLALVGVVPGVLYAILVSAHASATLADA